MYNIAQCLKRILHLQNFNCSDVFQGTLVTSTWMVTAGHCSDELLGGKEEEMKCVLDTEAGKAYRNKD